LEIFFFAAFIVIKRRTKEGKLWWMTLKIEKGDHGNTEHV
jgi:hypothetical protein